MKPQFGDWQAVNGGGVPMAYVAIAACGHIRAVVNDDGSRRSSEEAAALALQGFTVELRPRRDALQNGSCSICDPATMEGLFSL